MYKKRLPVFGVGPIYVISCLIITILGYFLSKTELLESGDLKTIKFISLIIGGVFIIIGVVLWVYAVVVQKISSEIKNDKLVTSGVYSIVRNPIYSAFFLIFTGVLISAHNLYLFIFPIIFYLFLTILMQHTEEKWLLEKFGVEYEEYCSKVNRVIPWFKRK